MTGQYQSLLLTLLLQVGFMVALASLVGALRPLREVLTGDSDDPRWRLGRIIFEVFILSAGLRARYSMGFEAGDLSLEGAFLMGWTHGRLAGLFTGIALGGISWHAGWVPALPALVIVGFGGAYLSSRFKNASLWLAGGESVQAPIRELVICGFTLMLMKACWLGLSWAEMVSQVTVVRGFGSFLLSLLLSVVCVAAPLWIWRGLRVEAELVRRTRQMERARMETLIERFRPHFLFNTLGAIVSLMRTDVEGARSMTLKLAGLLRRSLEENVTGFVPLREEMRFLDDYLSIESIRHGERLRVTKEIGEDLLDFPVPRMILQPLVENAILHGIDPKVEGGTVSIRARRNGLGLRIEIEDDGVGLSKERSEGIGLKNLRARLKLAYGDGARLELVPSSEKGGAKAILDLPARRAV